MVRVGMIRQQIGKSLGCMTKKPVIVPKCVVGIEPYGCDFLQRIPLKLVDILRPKRRWLRSAPFQGTHAVYIVPVTGRSEAIGVAT